MKKKDRTYRKSHRETHKLLRTAACTGCIIMALSIMGIILYAWWVQIPATIRIRAGEEESFEFLIPASGEVYLEAIEVGEFGSNVQRESYTVDLRKKVTFTAESLKTYHMDVRLFGILPLKQVNIQVIEDRMVIPAGIPIGIYVETNGVLVVGIGEFQGSDGITYAPAKYVLKQGDYITKVNGIGVEGKKQFMELVEEHGKAELELTIKRGEQQLILKVVPKENQNGENKLGIWVRDNAQGIGTLTFIDENNNFGALGHGINDVDTGTLMVLEEGLLYNTNIISIRRGSDGSPGELTGMISYSDKNVIGEITNNTAAGIFGVFNLAKPAVLNETELIPIGLKQEIHPGKAQIISTVNNEREYYDIEITEVRLDHDNINRGIVIEVTDKKLLSLTGGIVQGMSGSPILQDGKLIGAVTHVLVQDSAKGYGIFIENMLQQ